MNSSDIIVNRQHLDLDDRQAAERKLCKFFASFGMDAMEARDRLIDPYITRAARFWRNHHGIDFAALVLDEAEIDLQAWFANIFGTESEEARSSLMTGRAAFLMCGGSERFADLFLRPVGELPDEFILAIREHAPRAVPPSDDGDMHHQPYEAWSPLQVMAKAVPLEKLMMPSFGDFIRRDGRVLGVNWRNTGPTS